MANNNPRIVRRGEGDLNLVYRPLRFSELYGPTRKAAVQFYNWLVNYDRTLTKHSFLISGESGAGKTTLALIISLALNCEDPQPNPRTGDEVEPCLECNSCKRILRGAMNQSDDSPVKFYNSPSIDKDRIRWIVENEIKGPKPVYGARVVVTVFDEAHGLTWDQRQPLLITLEDLPKYSYVFFLTSRPEKFRQLKDGEDNALYSRIGIVDLVPWTEQHIYELLRDIGIVEHSLKRAPLIDEKALRYLAQLGNGNPRTSISALDVILNGVGNSVEMITLAKVKEFYPGIVDLEANDTSEEMQDVFRAFYNNDLKLALQRLEEMEKKRFRADNIKYSLNKFLRNRVYQYARQGNQLKLQEFSQKLKAFSVTAFARDGEDFSNLVAGVINALTLPN